MKYGLKQRDIKNIQKAVKDFPEIEKVIIFGSRAMGNFKNGSDIDIAIKGQNITRKIITRFTGLLNYELPIPFFIDVVNYDSISNNELMKHIDNEGKLLFERD